MKKLRLPAVPLVTVDPHLNIWSCRDTLTEDFTRHWTGARNSMFGVIVSNRKAYRFMGKLNNDGIFDKEPDAMKQTGVKVTPLQTVYTFENDLFELELKFTTPLLPDDLKLMSRPVSYISYSVHAKDGEEHEAEIFFGISSELAVNTPDQSVSAKVYENGACCGHGKDGMLTKSGDNMRIDWGYLHFFSRDFNPHVMTMKQIISHLMYYNEIETYDGTEPFEVRSNFASLCLSKNLKISSEPEKGFVCVGYDDIHSIMYFGKMIDAYYKKDGDDFENVRVKALKEYEELMARCDKFDGELIAEASEISGDYAQILSAAYRQAVAAHKLTWDGEEHQFFSKECFSNGCIGTVDVTYPSFPLFLRYNPDLAEGMLNPIFKYLKNGWEFPYAPHDVGQYPIANGQVYGLDHETGVINPEFQMPIEECGNMIICVASICRVRRDYSCFKKHIDVLKQWAQYLTEYGLDPENQLCTDDFSGHLAHNCNLSVKAIVGIACFGDMLNKSGEGDGDKYIEKARSFAAEWMNNASDGDHYRLAFDGPGSWSIKYNLVWDRLMELNIFDKDIFTDEIAYYKTKINEYGVPLDIRDTFTKSDWQMWSAWLTDDKEYRDAVITAMCNFLNETPDRAPFSDWYDTKSPRKRSFQNRTVQGGLFIGLIENRM